MRHHRRPSPPAPATAVARFRLTGGPVPPATAHEVAPLRVAQSAFANTVHHARATTAEATLGCLGGRIALDVVDDGCGFSRGRPPTRRRRLPAGRHAPRVNVLGGTPTVVSASGHGTAPAARLPLAPPTEPAAHP
ncbi:hypothetical protein [Streptomyces sp. SCL15-4]|uniref:ATP-binding protein n=1 Tax=Streptomyces sp. SCL15-4 TaxID=2967221 RepID=UPI002966F5D1|nr:hypothetical protein [Streptomyces sp. SCL15-4]